MKNILVGIISAALIALGAACSSQGVESITSPSALAVSDDSPLYDDWECKPGGCVFVAEMFPGTASQWHGETEPDRVPALGHPGHLTVVFPKEFQWGATLKWEKFRFGGDSLCEITNDQDPTWKHVVPNHCGDGSGTLLVYPGVTTEYTFTSWANPQISNRRQVAKVRVTMPDTFTGVTATWVPRPGFNLEDPVPLYEGTASGPLNNLVADLKSPVHVHCGLGGGGEYVQLKARMALIDAGKTTQRFEGTYDGNPACVAAKGSFTLTREQ